MKRPARWILQAIAVLLPALAIYAWQTRDLLPAGERIAAPEFHLPALSGGAVGLDALRGRTTVLYFFAPWCGVCAASSPQLRWFDRWMGDEVQLVLVGLDWSNRAELEAYAARHELSMPVLAAGPALAADYRIRGYPTYYVLDADGRIAGRDFGYTTAPGLWLRTRGL
jgi:thiol-disulfide isomerase/thioredoxin